MTTWYVMAGVALWILFSPSRALWMIAVALHSIVAMYRTELRPDDPPTQ